MRPMASEASYPYIRSAPRFQNLMSPSLCRTMTASLTAGRTTAKVRGKTMPNEDAGTASFLGTLPARDSLFAALAKEQTLVVAIGPSRERIPLRDIGDKAGQFSGACQKK